MNKENKTSNEQDTFLKLILLVAIVISMVAMYFFFTSEIKDKPLAGRGSEIDRNSELGEIGTTDFKLTDHDGNEFIGGSLLGKPAIVYFGFAECPEICPAAVRKISILMNDLEKIGIDANAVFISLDPARDTPQLLKEFLENYTKKIRGLTGKEEMIKKVADAFKIYAEKVPNAQNSADYLIDHTPLIYVLNEDGEYVNHFHLDSEQKEMLDYFRINFK